MRVRVLGPVLGDCGGGSSVVSYLVVPVCFVRAIDLRAWALAWKGGVAGVCRAFARRMGWSWTEPRERTGGRACGARMCEQESISEPQRETREGGHEGAGEGACVSVFALRGGGGGGGHFSADLCGEWRNPPIALVRAPCVLCARTSSAAYVVEGALAGHSKLR